MLSQQETSLPRLSSYHSFGSTEDSLGRQESIDSRSSASSCGSYSFCDSDSPYNLMISGSGKTAQNQKDDLKQFSRDNTASVQLAASCRNSLQAKDTTSKELIADARMWEQNSQNLKIDLEMSRKEFADQTQQIANLKMEIHSLGTEHMDSDEKILKEELRIQKESNDNMSFQLNKTQESNIQLVSILQEMEETVEKQKLEIKNLLEVKSDSPYIENQQNLEEKLQQLHESQKNLENTTLHLENIIREKTHEIELEREVSKTTEIKATADCDLIKENKTLKKKIQQLEIDCKELTEENMELLYKLKSSGTSSISGPILISKGELLSAPFQDNMAKKKIIAETAASESKQKTCDQEENLAQMEFHSQVKDNASRLNAEINSCCIEVQEQDQRTEIAAMPSECQLEENCHGGFTHENVPVMFQSSEQGQNLSSDSLAKNSEILELKTECLKMDAEIEALRHHQTDLRAQIFDLQMSKCLMEERTENMQQEFSATSKSLNTTTNDLMFLHQCICGGVSKMASEMKSLELESDKYELDLNLHELEKENVDLSERVSGLEAQLRHLTDAMEFNRLELQHSGNRVSLQDKIKELEHEKESQKLNTKEKLLEMHKRWLDAQEECEYLKKVNPKLQATTESLMEECRLVQNLNTEQRQQKLKLYVSHSALEAELRKSQYSFSTCLKRIVSLDANFSSALEEIESKEKILKSKLDNLHIQTKEHGEKLLVEDRTLHEMSPENIVEVEKLQEQVQSLMVHMSDLMSDLGTSKAKEGTLAANCEKLLRTMEHLVSNEAKLKHTINELESKLLSSECQMLQMTEENSILNIQLHTLPLLQEEVLDLRGALSWMKFESEITSYTAVEI
ncbi:hypothetical protein K7X08_021490 [Anisodus acutangulus]|uniref:Uncharacterized protein n=1 Tax=Anisodus acutangulus TaxID=402998 RepID=A0A9Q1M4C8_9SOLA|nr:hypothetical protein K7X08_021490 [Anisodus acutangulus]